MAADIADLQLPPGARQPFDSVLLQVDLPSRTYCRWGCKFDDIQAVALGMIASMSRLFFRQTDCFYV